MFLWGEMNSQEIAKKQREVERVIVPCGSTEQHGPHLPTTTDTLCVFEVAKRVAEKCGALVVPPLFFGLSYPHRGFPGTIELSLKTYIAVIQDVALSLARGGWKKIVFLNGHYDNLYAIAYALSEAYPSFPEGTIAYTLSYWEGISEEVSRLFTENGKGLHSGMGETALCLAIREDLVDRENMVAEFLNLYPLSSSVHLAYFFTHPGSLFRATVSGVWGDPSKATKEMGEDLLRELVKSCARLITEVEKVFIALPKRRRKRSGKS